MPDIVRGFLSELEIELLRVRATVGEGWRPGRQGTGYDILPLKELMAGEALVERALAHIGTPSGDFWDVYLIRYVDGAHVPDHVDAAQPGLRHRRLNALITAAEAGGELTIAGERVELGVGDAVCFYPDEELHRVEPVTGTRLLFSVGAWL